MNRKLIETKYLEETYFKLISLHIFYLMHNLDIGELLQHNYWILITLNVSIELNFFATNSDFIIPISLQPKIVHLGYFKQSVL